LKGLKEDATEEQKLRTDVILKKFLVASDNKVDVAVSRILKTLEWRKEFKVSTVGEETFPDDFKTAGFLHSTDQDGRPIMYNIYGVNYSIFEGFHFLHFISFHYLFFISFENYYSLIIHN